MECPILRGCDFSPLKHLDLLCCQHLAEGFCLVRATAPDGLAQVWQGKSAAGKGLFQCRCDFPVHGVGEHLDFPDHSAFDLELHLDSAPGELVLTAEGEGKLLSKSPIPAAIAVLQSLHLIPVQLFWRKVFAGRMVDLLERSS